MTRVVCVALLLASPARALDCSTVTIEVGKPLSDAAAECLRIAAVATTLRAETCEAQLVASRIETDACHATAAITCPPPEPPVVPVVLAAVVGLVVGFGAAVALLIGVGR